MFVCVGGGNRNWGGGGNRQQLGTRIGGGGSLVQATQAVSHHLSRKTVGESNRKHSGLGGMQGTQKSATRAGGTSRSGTVGDCNLHTSQITQRPPSRGWALRTGVVLDKLQMIFRSPGDYMRAQTVHSPAAVTH